MKLLRLLALAFALATALAAQTTPAVKTATLTFTWDYPDSAAPASEFRIYQQGAGGAWTMVKSVTGSPAPKTAKLENVTPGVYVYRVTSISAWGESPPSETVSTPGAPVQPTNPRVQVLVQVTVAVP